VTQTTLIAAPKRMVELTVDGETVRVLDGSTILDACRMLGNEQPTLCYGDTLTPVNVCRVCVVEVEGARTLVPSCSRKVEAGMVVRTDSERVRHSRKMVLEFLASSVDLSTTPDVEGWMSEYGCRPDRYGPAGDAANFANPAFIGSHVLVESYNQNTDTINQLKLEGSWHDDQLKFKYGVQFTHDSETLRAFTDLPYTWQMYAGYGPSPVGSGGVAPIPANLIGWPVMSVTQAMRKPSSGHEGTGTTALLGGMFSVLKTSVPKTVVWRLKLISAQVVSPTTSLLGGHTQWALI